MAKQILVLCTLIFVFGWVVGVFQNRNDYRPRSRTARPPSRNLGRNTHWKDDARGVGLHDMFKPVKNVLEYANPGTESNDLKNTGIIIGVVVVVVVVIVLVLVWKYSCNSRNVQPSEAYDNNMNNDGRDEETTISSSESDDDNVCENNKWPHLSEQQ